MPVDSVLQLHAAAMHLLRRGALIALVAIGLASPPMAVAQTISAPPTVQAVDGNGVNLLAPGLSLQDPVVGIGPKEGGLYFQHTRRSKALALAFGNTAYERPVEPVAFIHQSRLQSLGGYSC